MNFQRGARTTEGSVRTMTNLSTDNRELTGHPEVPDPMRGFRNEKTHFADSAGAAGGAGAFRRAGACTSETRLSEGSGNRTAQDRNQPARASSRDARRA